MSVLNGLMDSDGCWIEKDGRKYRAFSATYKEFADFIIEACKRARMPFSAQENLTNFKKGIGKVFYQVSLPSKRGKQFYEGNLVLGKVERIKAEQYSGKVHNLGVKNRNTYIANGLLVHNCYVTYCRATDNKFVVLDWCYWVSKKPIADRPTHEQERNYNDENKNFGIWFSWNERLVFGEMQTMIKAKGGFSFGEKR